MRSCNMTVPSLLRDATNVATDDAAKYDPQLEPGALWNSPAVTTLVAAICKMQCQRRRTLRPNMHQDVHPSLPRGLHPFSQRRVHLSAHTQWTKCSAFPKVSAPPLRCHQPCHSAHAGCRPRPPYHGENHREAGVGTRLGKSTNCKLGGGAEIQHLDLNQ